jgi:CHAT domain-containing protein
MRYLILLSGFLIYTSGIAAFPAYDTLLERAKAQVTQVDWDSTEYYLAKILDKCQAEDDLLGWMGACKAIGRLTDDAGFPEQSLVFFRMGTDADRLRVPQDSLEWDALGWLHVNLAFTHYNQLEDFQSAMKAYQEAKTIIVDRLRVEDYYTARYIYKPMANIFTRFGDYQSAAVLLSKSLAIHTATEDLLEVAKTYNDLALVHFSNGENEKAVANCAKGLALPALSPVVRCMLLTTQGKAFAGLGQLEGALSSSNDAIDAIEDLWYEEKDPNILPWLGACYSQQGAFLSVSTRWDAAEAAFQKAYQYFRDYYPSDHFRDIAKLHIAWGQMKEQSGDYTEAVSHFQEALKSIIPGFRPENEFVNPEVNQLFAENTIQEALSGKAEALFGRYQLAKDAYDLEVALEAHELIFEVDQHLRRVYNYESAQLSSVEETRLRCASAIKVALALREATTDPHYAFKAFEFAERSKSILLLQASQQAHAREVAGIPMEKRMEELAFQKQIANLETALFVEQPEHDSMRLALEKELFDTQQAFTNWRSELEADYPMYFQLKYDFALPDLTTIRKEILQQDQGLIEYFVGESSIFVFYLDQKQFEVFEWQKDLPLADRVVQWRQDIEQFQFSGQDRAALCDRYTQTGQQLYQELLGRLPNLPPQLLIIPSGILGFLPFEALLTEAPSAACAFEEYPYLLKKHTISYGYSVTLQQLLQRGRQTGFAHCIGFAPHFDGSQGMAALAYTQATVETAVATAGGQALIGTDATIANFQKEAPRYELIQLATHAKANTEQADFSCILFSDGAGGYDTLFVNDIYQMELSADLVVLSACETALGKLYQGEGIISLARAFLYAGSKSVITTLWQINDDANEELMAHFYTALKGGQSKSAALRAAKMQYLEANKSLYAHPVYWAGFTPIGNMKSVYAGNNWWLWIVGLGIGFGILGFRRWQKNGRLL